MLIHLYYFGLAVVLFWIVNWLGRRSTSFGYLSLSVLHQPDDAPAFNFLFRVETPLIFMILVSTAFYSLHFDNAARTSFFIPIYYFGFRLLYNVAMGWSGLLNWPVQIVQISIGSGLAYLLGRELIATKKYLLPDLSTIGNEL